MKNEKMAGLGVSITDIINAKVEPDNGNAKVIDYRVKDDFKFDVMADEVIPDANAVLMQGDTAIFSMGDISTLSGLAKSRKTFLIASMATAFLSDGFMAMHSEIENKRCLIIDTEQSRPFVLKLVRRIYRLMKWDFQDNHSDRLRVLSLRELKFDERYKVLVHAINQMKPQLVFIDGSADLIADSNNMDESTAMVQSLMKLSSEKKCHICNVVHTNPNSEKTRGHFGSELQRKSESVLLLTRSGDITTVKPQFTRSLEFQPFSFRINEVGLPEQVELTNTKKAEENLEAIFEEIYSYAEFLCYGDLRDKIAEIIGKGKTACENRITKGLAEKYIYKDINGMYRFYAEPEETDVFKNNDNDILPF